MKTVEIVYRSDGERERAVRRTRRRMPTARPARLDDGNRAFADLFRDVRRARERSPCHPH